MTGKHRPAEVHRNQIQNKLLSGATLLSPTRKPLESHACMHAKEKEDEKIG
jgi:hypothetical protein